MSFRVLHPGTFSLLVDLGRPTSRSLGVPLGGAADRAALMIGNGLLGNSPDVLALEMTLSGPALRAEEDVCCCVFGAPFSIRVEGEPIDAARVFTVRSGRTLRIGPTPTGARGYLCVRGGFEARPVLESRSAFAPIAEGALLSCATCRGSGLSLPHSDVTGLLEEKQPADLIRVIDGPQASWFPKVKLEKFEYRVSVASNRMGIRLEGPPLPRPKREMTSEAVAPGAIQVANDGQPIILGVDGQTIGGYPKIAHVIDADLDRVGQLRPGQSVRLIRIDLSEAEAIAENRRSRLRQWLTYLRLAQG